jgi:NADH-ubiquinone oxidoreductase chain 5
VINLTAVLIILAVFSIFFGYIFKDLYIGLGSAFFADNSIFIHPSHEIMIETEFAVPTLFKLLPFICTVVFTIIALVVSEFSTNLLMQFKYSRLGYNIFIFFNQRFFIELFYNKYVVGSVLKLGGQTTKILDRGSLELIGPYGLEKGLLVLGKNISYLDTGVITSYALYILVGLTFYISLPYIYSFDQSLLVIIIFGLFSLIDLDSTQSLNNNNRNKY